MACQAAQPGMSSGPRGAGRSLERQCREPSVPSTGTQLPRARVSPLATGQQSPTSPTWSCRRGAQVKGGRWYRAQEEEKQKGLVESQGLPEGQSLPERQRRVREAPPGRARQMPKNTAASPMHRHDDWAEALRPTPHPGYRELLRGKNAPFLIRKERGPDGCYTW